MDMEAIEQERHDADVEHAQLVEAGRDASRGHRAMLRLRAAGQLADAAAACRHGWGYPTDALAAEHNADPRAGQPGARCLHCGSWWSAEVLGTGELFLWKLNDHPATAPCELEPRQ
jgi:hypothetical protein